MMDELGDTFYIDVDGKKCAVIETPSCHRTANVMGLSLLILFEFSLKKSGAAFFASPVTYL